ncbi:MAG: FAD-dependent oxidoreductase, partial [Dehalococcoidales bacterium]|nr:FAD-dependent oxidoreductase [Dehalococcoidales bacterium]
LARRGHAVTVFEMLPLAGGMLRVGIPRYRLPAEVLDSEIDYIRRAGVTILTNHRVNSIAELREQGFDAVFLACGAHAGRRMNVPGENSPGVIDCVSFLRDVALGIKPAPGRRVAVVGGGNAAMDAARTARRLGADTVTVFYRRSREEMPADKEEIEAAMEEGIKFEFLTNPTRIERKNGALLMTCVRMRLGSHDETGRRRPEAIAGSEFTTEFDTVIAAVGQTTALPDGMDIPRNKDGTVRVNPDSLATGVEGVFAGGDAVSGPASVIEAIAAGKQAAVSIDKYLGGSGIIEEKLAPPEEGAQPFSGEEGEARRPEMPVRPVAERIKDFRICELGYTPEMALAEVRRCLRCDLEEH